MFQTFSQVFKVLPTWEKEVQHMKGQIGMGKRGEKLILLQGNV